MRKCAWLILAMLMHVVSSQEVEEESTPPPFVPPAKPKGEVYFAESFSDAEETWRVWVKSEATKGGAESDVAKYDGEVVFFFVLFLYLYSVNWETELNFVFVLPQGTGR